MHSFIKQLSHDVDRQKSASHTQVSTKEARSFVADYREKMEQHSQIPMYLKKIESYGAEISDLTEKIKSKDELIASMESSIMPNG